MKTKEHKHCVLCGKVMPEHYFDDKLCKECKDSIEVLPGVDHVYTESWP